MYGFGHSARERVRNLHGHRGHRLARWTRGGLAPDQCCHRLNPSCDPWPRLFSVRPRSSAGPGGLAEGCPSFSFISSKTVEVATVVQGIPNSSSDAVIGITAELPVFCTSTGCSQPAWHLFRFLLLHLPLRFTSFRGISSPLFPAASQRFPGLILSVVCSYSHSLS